MTVRPQSLRNPHRDPGAPVAEAPAAPFELHRRLPGYEPTPLRDEQALADQDGVARVLVKDEAWRLGLPAFKMLGASWACYRSLVERLGTDPEPWSTVEELATALEPLGHITLATATDGNHGRAVARMARLVGADARIWVPGNTVASRIEAIESEGASVTVVPGNYDEAVRAAAAAADERTLVVSDTSWEGYEAVPAWVIEGYSTIFREVDRQVAAAGLPHPDVVVTPIGVGALAASVVTHYRRPDAPPTTIVGVEPTQAACLLESIRAGQLVTLPGAQDSIMAGLNCGTGSPVAWPRVSRGIDWFVAVDDDGARRAMRRLAGVGIVSGESGAAALAGLTQLRADTGPEVVGPASTVLVLSTEGATDPVAYRKIVGADPAEVATRAAPTPSGPA